MQIKHLFNLERETKLNQVQDAQVNTVGNGAVGTNAKNEFETNQPLALVSAFKAELEKEGFLNTPEAQVKFRQLEKLAQLLQIGFKDQLTATSQSFKSERQRLLAIVEQMRMATDVDTLLKTTVSEVRHHLEVDRAIIYRFQDRDRGVILAE